MPPSPTARVVEPVELSIEDVILNKWEEDSGDYLRLNDDSEPPEPPSQD